MNPYFDRACESENSVGRERMGAGGAKWTEQRPVRFEWLAAASAKQRLERCPAIVV
jgi:hypothetical protein